MPTKTRLQTALADIRASLEKCRYTHGGRNWQAIADEADVSYSWLTKVYSGAIKDPSLSPLLKLDRVLHPTKIRKEPK